MNVLCRECGVSPATDDGLCRGCAAREAREERLTTEHPAARAGNRQEETP